MSLKRQCLDAEVSLGKVPSYDRVQDKVSIPSDRSVSLYS